MGTSIFWEITGLLGAVAGCIGLGGLIISLCAGSRRGKTDPSRQLKRELFRYVSTLPVNQPVKHQLLGISFRCGTRRVFMRRRYVLERWTRTNDPAGFSAEIYTIGRDLVLGPAYTFYYAHVDDKGQPRNIKWPKGLAGNETFKMPRSKDLAGMEALLVLGAEELDTLTTQVRQVASV